MAASSTLDMGARGDLRHHAAKRRVQGELRPHHIGKDRAPAVAVAAHHGSRRLIAARLDAEDKEGALGRAFGHGALYRVRPGPIEGGAGSGH